MAKIRVLVCDDQAVVREGLELILNSDKEIHVVGLAEDGLSALDLIPQAKPDVVLMDLKMPVMNGIQATAEIHKQYPQVRVLVLTTFAEDEWLFDAVRSGAAGYLLKGTPRQEIIAAVKGTFAGKTYLDPDVGGRLMKEVAKLGAKATTLQVDLSPRELDVLNWLAKGSSNSEIAEQLHLSQGTVRNYVSGILTKLEVKDRTQAALFAIKYGLVQN